MKSRHRPIAKRVQYVGVLVQFIMGAFGVYLIITNHFTVGLFLLLPALFVDLFLQLSRLEKIKTGVKLILFVQGITLWYLFVASHGSGNDRLGHQSGSRIVEVKDARLARTRSLPKKWSATTGSVSRDKDDQSRRMEEYTKVIDRHKARRHTSDTSNDVYIKHDASKEVILRIFGDLPRVDFPDLKYRDTTEVHQYLSKVFEEMPSNGFSSTYRNPCWMYPAQWNAHLPATLKDLFHIGDEGEEGIQSSDGNKQALACLPYAYVLGQPKCGTSDLFERLKRHPDIRMPGRKEVRWLTRGEFMNTEMPLEGHEPHGVVAEGRSRKGVRERGLSELTSIFSFTNAFDGATREIYQHPDQLITIDGGPHTFWWPTQEPDGSLNPTAIPPPQVIREIQPDAKFIITLTDPVKRHYSDYYFLDDNRNVVRPGAPVVTPKTAQTFHDRSAQQVDDFKRCVDETAQDLLNEKGGDQEKDQSSDTGKDKRKDKGKNKESGVKEGHPVWFRASQICAHDRYQFGKAGWGRLSIGLYALYLEKWLEHFAPNQFLITRLEDYERDPKAYMKRLFVFLGVQSDELEQDRWTSILAAKHANEHHGEREPLWAETETLLREFYAPYNKLLAAYTEDKGYLWSTTVGHTLHDKQTIEQKTLADAAALAAAMEGHDGQNEGLSDHRGGSDMRQHGANAGPFDVNRKKRVETELMERQRRKSEAIRARRMNQMNQQRKREQQEEAELYPHIPHGAVDEGDGRDGSGSQNGGSLGEGSAGDGGLAAARRRAMEGLLGGGAVGANSELDAKRRAMMERNRKLAQEQMLLTPGQRMERRDGGDLHYDQHGVHRHFTDLPPDLAQGQRLGPGQELGQGQENLLLPPSQRNNNNNNNNRLRGNNPTKEDETSMNSPAVDGEEEEAVPITVVLNPHSFSIDGLTYPSDGQFNEWMRDSGIVNVKKIRSNADAARQLCNVAFSLDLAALKFLLYDTGIPPNEKHPEDADRNALHCLGMISTMADAHAKSQVFGLLKGKPTWLTPYLDPPLPLLVHSVLARDIVGSLEKATGLAAEWLLRAGTSPTLKDWAGYTPLHLAALSGMETFVKLLLECEGVDIDAANVDGRTPLHFAVVYGHAVVAGILVENGADMTIEDHYGVRAIDVISNPGPISAEDAKNLLNIDQRAPRKIDRVIHPERVKDSQKGWLAGDGGWGDERLEGYETDMQCQVDQYWAHEINEEDLFRNYLASGVPVLIRGLIDTWPVVEKFTDENLKADHGHITVPVSDIPYAGKFGGAGKIDMTLGEYIDEVKDHRLVGGKHPWYVFRGHPIPHASEKPESLVPYDDLPTPRLLQKAFERMNAPSARGKEGVASREIFVNAQWALGGEGTGAPVHFHNTAWNALIYGAKKWIIYPPHNMIMSNKQILDFFETDKKDFFERGVKGQSCVQVAGDVMIVPESWGHGVLNIQQTVAVATEVKASLWRVRPPTSVIQHLPNDNRKMA